MNLGLEGRRALVTGSSRGIGRSIAETLEREGCAVTLTGRNRPENLLVRGSFFQGDLTVAAVREELAVSVERMGLDVLVLNLGSGRSKRPLAEDEAEWHRMLSLNLDSAASLFRRLVPALEKSRGCALFVSSIAGLEASGAPTSYTAAKAALNAFAKAASRELGPRGVRVNIVCPGNILFPGSSWEVRLAADRVGVEEMLRREVPLGRWGRPEEIADAVAFLCSERAAFVTGATIVADGGQTRGF